MSGSSVEARISGLSPAQRALLERRIRGEASVGPDENKRPSGVPPRADRTIAPLSLAQEGLWLRVQAAPESTVFNNYAALRIVGDLRTELLVEGLADVVRRQEILRSCFRVVDGAPAQIVLPLPKLVLDTADLSHVPADQSFKTMRAWMVEKSRPPFDLEKGETFRANLLRLGDKLHVFMLTVHHIVSDGWSFQLLFRDILRVYTALVGQQEARSSTPPVQYGDYAAWQRATIQSAQHEKQLAHLRKKLEGASLLLDLPSDRPRPPIRAREGGTLTFELSAKLTHRIRMFCKQHRTTMFMSLLSAFAILLHRCGGNRNALIGSPVTDRPFPEVEGLIGLFVNMVVFRTDFEDDPTVADFVSRVRLETLETYEQRAIPFDHLIGSLRIRREQSHAPVFQTMFVMQPARSTPFSAPGLEIEYFVGTHGGALLDLGLSMSELPKGTLFGSFDFASDMFSEPTVRRLVDCFTVLLEAMTGNPTLRLSDLPLMRDEVRDTILMDWGVNAARENHDLCLHEMVAAQAKRKPDAVAVICDGQRLTFAELEARSSQFAHHLVDRGVGPDVVVGLCLERSPKMIVGMLGVLKAGGAYLSLDPAYPQARLAFMLADARASIVVAQTATIDRLPGGNANMIVVQIDADWPLIARKPVVAPGCRISPDNLAYIIYTSGSTGLPKGVMTTHRATVNRIRAQAFLDPLQLTDVCCQKTAVGFVDSVFEILAPLSRGLPLVVIREECARDVVALAGRLREAGVTRLILVPSLLRSLLSVPALTEQMRGLRSITSSGEAIEPGLCAEVAKALPEVRLVNLYGSSEVAGDATGCVLSGDQVGCPIGRPLSGTSVYVLDGTMKPVPVGFSGELYVGGLGLARGYFHQPGLTAEWFVPSPFGSGERLYRTGDLARWRSDGNLELLGRRDHQVKIRGVRVELGEVESTLRAHPTVRQAVCVSRQDASGDRQLHAYVVGAEIDTCELRAHARLYLVENMVPVRIIALNEMPLLPSGKVDRSALPEAADGGTAKEHDFVLPRTGLEKTISNVWQELLKLDRIGIDSNFFDLGGHSIMLVHIYNRLGPLLERPVQITTLFQFPTVRTLAEHLSGDPDADLLSGIRERAVMRKERLTSRRPAQFDSLEHRGSVEP